VAIALTGPVALAAQTPAEMDLARRILTAEDRRDASDPVLAEARTHPDARIRLLARRAHDRIMDSTFASRDSLPTLPAPPSYPDPAWRLRYRALGARGVACTTVQAALVDSAWPVRFRAMAALTPSCADSTSLARLQMYATGSVAAVTWHHAAHATLSLARLGAPDAAPRIRALAAHTEWNARVYAVRAAMSGKDTTQVRALLRDRHPNVRAAAIGALSGSEELVDRAAFVRALRDSNLVVVLAAARALADAPEPEARRAANETFTRWAARDNDSERDVRRALLAAAGRPTSDDRPRATPPPVPAEAAALALGREARVRVTMARGGAFVVRLRGDAAPIMAARMLELVRSGYYDGRSWHRVEHDFVVQGGSPGSDEYVGHPRFLRDELGLVPHVRGTVGMSTRGHDTGDAQWFINLRDNLRLNRDYTVFGEIIDGIEVVDGILEGDVIASMMVIED
jgi:cyclophilin family peptidyl-prolyl cis-trans isomerase/HEAT repeat protein